MFQQLLQSKHHRLRHSKFGRVEVWVWSRRKLKKTRSVRSYKRAFKNLTVSFALQSQRSVHSKAILDESLITVDTTSLDHHKLYYCTISRSRCEISDDVMVLIWNFLRDMYGHARYERYERFDNTINNCFLS